MPMGVASISLTRPMPCASTARTCSGSLAPRMAASSAGIRLSKISVVLPEPETPVTTVRRPLGMRTSSGLTVWSAAVASRIVPSANICSRATAGRSRSFCAPGPRKGPISERPLAASAGTVPLRQNVSAVRAGPGAHLHDPVGLREHLCVVVYEQDGIAVRHKIVHDGGQPHDVGRVQADRRLVEHIQHAGRAVAHRPRQLHALALTGRERGGGAVQRKIAKP